MSTATTSRESEALNALNALKARAATRSPLRAAPSTVTLTKSEFAAIRHAATAENREARRQQLKTVAAWKRVNALRSVTEARLADRLLLIKAGVLVRVRGLGVVWTDASVNLRSISEMREFLK